MATQFNFSLGTPENAPKNMKPPKAEQSPMDLLRPGSDHHKYVLEYLLERIKGSEDKMSTFYARWQVAERKMQAYLSLPNYEQMLRNMNDSSRPPAPAIILFPYKYAVISTIVTHCMQVFTAQKPYFPMSADSAEAADVVRYMQVMVQHHCEVTKMIMRLFQLLLDGEVYGLAVVRTIWNTKRGKRRIIRPMTEAETFAVSGRGGQIGPVRDVEERVIYAGNDVVNIDPFMFFPDPNVPMVEVSEKGEYVFWREFVGKHILMLAQQQGQLRYVDSVDPKTGTNHDSKWYNLSHRSALSQGDSHAGDNPRNTNYSLKSNNYMVDQGSVTIIPKELGLGDSEKPEKWLFMILNKKQIVQAQPLDMDHDRHPIEVSEPYSLGYGFGQPALGDYIGPIQDFLSWLLDSHIYNVRATLNNQWVYDPSKINGDDLKYPQPGKQIRLKPLAYGTDVRTAIQQLPVQDVTKNHMQDISTFLKVGDMVSAVNDPMRGVTPEGGRRTATETRRVGDAAGSRMGSHAKLISQMALCRMAGQMVSNIQQYQEQDYWIKVIGEKAFAQHGQQLLTADFTYNVHDGSLPLDRVASFDLWKEILLGVAQSPVIQQTHSLPRIFENVCALGGAPNITSYRLVDDATMDQLARGGNVIPMGQAVPDPSRTALQ